MDHRSELLRAWLEGEGERLRRRIPLPPHVGDPAVRGRVHVGVCALVGTLTAGLFICWLITAGSKAAQATALEEFRLQQIYGEMLKTGELEGHGH